MSIKIAIVDDYSKYTYSLLKSLYRLIHKMKIRMDVILLAPKYIYGKPELGTKELFSTYEFKTNIKECWTTFDFFITIPVMIVKNRVTLTHIQYEHTAFGHPMISVPLSIIMFILLYIIKKIVRIPIMITLHRFDPTTRIDKIIARIISSIADEIIVHARFIKKYLTSLLGMQPNKVRVIVHGSYIPEHIDFNLENLVKEIGRPVFLFFGTISPRKGLHILLKAFEGLCLNYHKHRSCKLYIIGYIPNHYKRYGLSVLNHMNSLRKKGLQVIYLGAIPEPLIHKILNINAIVIFPYIKMRAASGALHHAIGHLKPIIATETEYFKEVFGVGGALLIRPNSVEQLIYAMEELSRSVELRKKLLSELMNKVLPKYSWDMSAKKHLYEYLIQIKETLRVR